MNDKCYRQAVHLRRCHLSQMEYSSVASLARHSHTTRRIKTIHSIDINYTADPLVQDILRG